MYISVTDLSSTEPSSVVTMLLDRLIAEAESHLASTFAITCLIHPGREAARPDVRLQMCQAAIVHSAYHKSAVLCRLMLRLKRLLAKAQGYACHHKC